MTAHAPTPSKSNSTRPSGSNQSEGSQAAVAHDFNNLLTVISGYTEALLEDPDPGGIKPELDEIAAAAQRATSLARQLCPAFSRRPVLQPRVIDLNDIVGSLTPMLRRLIGEHIELTAPVDPNLDPVLADDSGQIEQILVNLVVNSPGRDAGGGREDHDRNGERRLTTTTWPSTPKPPPGRHAMLAVTVTPGSAWTAETMREMFEPFFTTKPVGIGTGLGFRPCYGIVKQSGGNVWVYSEPGQGTSFKVYIPTTNSPATHDEALPPHKPAPCGTETILLAEDEPALRTLTARMLTNHGYTVIPAESPERALRSQPTLNSGSTSSSPTSSCRRSTVTSSPSRSRPGTPTSESSSCRAMQTRRSSPEPPSTSNRS